MSKTLKMNVTFPMSIVVKTETVLEFQKDRKLARELSPEKVAKFKGEQLAGYHLLVGDRSDEEVLEIIYRKGIRETVREGISRELPGSEATVTVGDIKVSFEEPMQPRSCDRCTQESCYHPNRAGNIGCELKTTGLREPVRIPAVLK
ncbi:host HNS inhibition protein [Pseudomonas phage vB_PpuP-Kompost-2]